MTENIEMHSFLSNNANDSDVQEYHEIKQDTRFDDTETTFTFKSSPKIFSEYDFFTLYDVKPEKNYSKKKKLKKKDKAASLMDIISCEIASTKVPIKENVIHYEHNVNEQKNSCLQTKSYLTSRRINKRSFIMDSERGWGQIPQVHKLTPVFPRVLENMSIVDASIHVEYVDPILFDDIINQNIERDKTEPFTRFLDITIKDIKFIHHHNFTLENVLCVKLIQYYKEHESCKKIIHTLANLIQVKRETKENLKKDLLEIKLDKDDVRFDPIVRKYTEEMLQLKENYIGAINSNKEIIHKILSLWSDIELVRERLKRIDTPYVLHITKEVLDDKEFENEWNTAFNLELADIFDKIEYQYVSEYNEYRKAKNECKLNTKKSIKPKLEIDESSVKKEVESTVRNIVIKDKINLTLSQKEDFCHSHIGKRIINTFKFEIYVDDIFVCESEHYNCDDMFCCEFIEEFSVQIIPDNKTLKLYLFEDDKMVSSYKINLLQIRNYSSNSDFNLTEFLYNIVVEPSNLCVGSGYSIKDIAHTNKIRLKSTSLFKDNLNTYSEANIKVGWNDKLQKNGTDTIKSSLEVGKQIKRLLHGIDKPDSDLLLSIISNVYEKDIDDFTLIETIQTLCKMEIKNNDLFTVDENNPDFIRLKLLHLRNIGNFNDIEDKNVPLYASQISTEQLDCLQKINENNFDIEYLNLKEVQMDSIEIQRFIGSKYLQKLNKNMLKNLNDHLLKKTHKDVVMDFNLSLRNLFTNQAKLITLATISDCTKQQMLKDCLNKQQEIQLTVIRAFNLLDRSSLMLEDQRPSEDDSIAGFKVRALRPFVRVNYNGVVAQTVTAIGCHPTWNHTLKLKTKLEPLSTVHIHIYDEYKANMAENYSEDEHSCRTVHYRYYNRWLGTLHVPLRTIISMGSLGGTFKITTPPHLFGYENIQTKESSSLIPEITQLLKKDISYITLQITTSLSNLGGLHAYCQPIPSSIEDDYLIRHLNNFVTEYTNEFPTRNLSLTFIDSAGRNKCVTQFLQPIPLPEKDFLPRNPRGESAISKSSGFSRSSSSSGRRKEIDAERVSQEEKESLYSVYDSDNLNRMINACLRYISLIPCYEVTESHAVTLLGLELLKILHGSPLDHTILLASYFIYLGIKCWIAFGVGLPRGPSSYVLIKHDLTTRRIVLENDQLFRSRGLLNKSDGYTWYVCDASSGEKCELRDVGCPLKNVEYVFDNENIWVNIQSSQNCDSISFDFSRSADWQPVFDRNVYVMKLPVVTDMDLYSPPCNVEALKVALETKIKAKIQKWRSHMKTIWNRYCSSLLRDTLPQWECWAFNPLGPKPGLSQKLKQLMVSYQIFGFPLNMAYINTKSVVSSVKATGIHNTDDPNVEFAIAVEVYAYPNNVISVWVFLASITRL